MSGGGGVLGAASPEDPSGEGGSGGWRRIYDRIEALLPRVEERAGDRERLEEITELSEAREKSLHARLLQAEASRMRWKTAYIELPLLRNPKIIELQENDLKDYRRCEDDDNWQLMETRTGVELGQNSEDHKGVAGDLRMELGKLKQAYGSLISNKDKEISGLVGVQDFLCNKLRTTDKENMALLRIKEVEAAQATEAAQTLQHNIEEMQLAVQKLQHNIVEMKVAAQHKDIEIGRLGKESVSAKKRVLILDGKLLEMHSLVKEKNSEIQILKNGNSECLKCKCASSVSNETRQECSKDIDDTDLEEDAETSQECSKDIDEIDLEEDAETSQECSKDIDEMDHEEEADTNQEFSKDIDEMDHDEDTMQIFVKIRDGKTISLSVKRSDTIYSVKTKIEYKEGIPAWQQRLMVDGELLVGSCTLEYHGIQESSTITLHFVRWGMHIVVKTLTFKIMTFEVEREDTVYNVKAKVFDEFGVVPSHQRIIFAGKQLGGDHYTLADYGIPNNQILYFVFRIGPYALIHDEAGAPLEWRIQGRIHISVRTPTGRTIIDRFVMRSETVGRIKAQIHDELCIPPEEQRLCWRGGGSEPLEDDCVLENTNSGYRFELVLRPCLPGGQ